MLIQKLKEEYELRYRIVQYKKYTKLYLYSVFEKNNVNLLYITFENLKIQQEKAFN